MPDNTNPLLKHGFRDYLVVVCLPRPKKGMGRLQFSDIFTELPVPPQVDGVVGTFYCILKIIYHSEHYGIIFGP